MLILGILIPTFLVVMTLRQKALNEKYAPIEHPILSEQTLFVAYQAGSKEAPANTWFAIDKVLTLPQPPVIWLDIHQTRDHQFVLYGHDYLEKYTDGKGHIGLTNWSELENLNAAFNFKDPKNQFIFRKNPQPLKRLPETLAKYPKVNFVLNVIANTKNIDLELIKIIEAAQATERVLIASPFDFLLKSMKKEMPRWLYGLGLAELTRLIMFASLNLEALIPLRGDLLIVTRKQLKTRISSRIIAELHRRKKKVIPGVISGKSELQRWLSLGVDGILTDAPQAVLR